jgi:hypothetical protein
MGEETIVLCRFVRLTEDDDVLLVFSLENGSENDAE